MAAASAAAAAGVRLHVSFQGRNFLFTKSTTKAVLLSCVITTKHMLENREVGVTGGWGAGPVIYSCSGGSV